MKMKVGLISLVFSLMSFQTFADSPLTSTDLAGPYRNESIVKQAMAARGKLTDELMTYLVNPKNEIAMKMAVINALGWGFNGQNNATTFLNFIKAKRGYANDKILMKKASGADLLCLAYLKALDNYFKLDQAILYAEAALKKNQKSYTFNIIAALIKAQKAMDSDWCAVYTITNKVRLNAKLTQDMHADVIKNIFEYMDLYQSSCK
jgi:hypothetical protein